MSGYIGSKASVTVVSPETDSRYVNVAGDTMTGDLTVEGALTVDTNTLFVDSTNNRVGIGTTSPATLLDVRDGVGSILTLGNTGTFAGGESSYLKFREASTQLAEIGWEANTNELRINNRVSLTSFYTANTERMRIDSSGNLLVGTTDNTPAEPGSTGNYGVSIRSGSSSQFSVNGTEAIWLNRDSSDGDIMRFRRSLTGVGSISVTSSATSYNTSSDYRLKEDVQPMVGASDRLMALKPVNFAWKVDGTRVDGFLAHEAQAVVPEAVTGERDAVDADGNPQYQGIDQSKLVPLLTAALQEALNEITDLKARVAALEGN